MLALEHGFDSSRDRIGAGILEYHRRVERADHFGQTGYRRYEYRCPRGERLYNHEAESLVRDGRHHGNIGRAVQCRQIVVVDESE